jgi:hypothetical protein
VLAFLTALWLVISAYGQVAAPSSAPLKAMALTGTVALLFAVGALPLRYGRLRYPIANADSREGGASNEGAGQSLLDEIANVRAPPKIHTSDSFNEDSLEF